MTGNEAMDGAERAAPTGRSAACGLHASASRDRADAGPTAGGGREGGDGPRRAAIGPVDPYLCGLLPNLNCGLLAQPALHGARGIGARARPDAVRSFRAFNRLRAVGERLFQA